MRNTFHVCVVERLQSKVDVKSKKIQADFPVHLAVCSDWSAAQLQPAIESDGHRAAYLQSWRRLVFSFISLTLAVHMKVHNRVECIRITTTYHNHDGDRCVSNHIYIIHHHSPCSRISSRCMRRNSTRQGLVQSAGCMRHATENDVSLHRDIGQGNIGRFVKIGDIWDGGHREHPKRRKSLVPALALSMSCLALSFPLFLFVCEFGSHYLLANLVVTRASPTVNCTWILLFAQSFGSRRVNLKYGSLWEAHVSSILVSFLSRKGF